MLTVKYVANQPRRYLQNIPPPYLSILTWSCSTLATASHHTPILTNKDKEETKTKQAFI
jgi:hypothetical protein